MKAVFVNLWSRISDLAHVETNDPSIQRKGFLLSLYHLLVLGILIYSIVDNGAYLFLHPSV